jgi:hypothetical protein
VNRLPTPPRMPWASLEAALLESERANLAAVDRYVIRATGNENETVRPGRRLAA